QPESLPSLYRVRPSDLVTLEQVQLQDDGVEGQLTTAHPKLQDGGRSLINFTRTLPAGGFHLYKQGSCP
ncbi:carotenoid cleavage dioxygenase, partial [Haematococcus lacustris]